MKHDPGASHWASNRRTLVVLQLTMTKSLKTTVQALFQHENSGSPFTLLGSALDLASHTYDKRRKVRSVAAAVHTDHLVTWKKGRPFKLHLAPTSD